MTPSTLRALKGSIAKWQKIVDGKGKDEGSTNCPLCTKFNKGADECAGCPVRNKTTRRFCNGTPFIDWSHHHNDKHSNYFGLVLHLDCPTCTRLAQVELDFLKGLLP
jgi:hypothetical protein